MPTLLKINRSGMLLRRRIQIRVQTFTHQTSKAVFWMRHGHGPLEAWNKAWRTL